MFLDIPILLDIRKQSFNVRVVRHWDRFHREVVDILSLKAIKASLDGLVKSLPRTGALELGDH